MSQHRPDRMLRSRGVAHGPVADQLLELRPPYILLRCPRRPTRACSSRRSQHIPSHADLLGDLAIRSKSTLATTALCRSDWSAASGDPGCLPAAEESEPSAASARSTHCRRRTCRKGRLSRRRPRSTTTARSPDTSKPAASPHRHQSGPPYSHRSPNRQSPDPPGRRPCDRLAAPLLLVDKVLSPRTPSIHRPVADP